jgi:hypothetical protein
MDIEVLQLCEWASINREKYDSDPVRLSHTFLVLLDSSPMTAGNALTGPIPSEIGYLSYLRELNLREWASINRVKKDSYPLLLSHTFLVLMDSSRMTDSNSLSGPIPSEIGYLWSLEVLYLREWASINRVKKDSYPVRLSHTFLVLMDSSRMTDNNLLSDPMPKWEIESLPLSICQLSKLLGEMFVVS